MGFTIPHQDPNRVRVKDYEDPNEGIFRPLQGLMGPNGGSLKGQAYEGPKNLKRPRNLDAWEAQGGVLTCGFEEDAAQPRMGVSQQSGSRPVLVE